MIQELNELLGDAVVLSHKSHAFHWNVKGLDFHQYHDFLGKYYEAINAEVDNIAEKVQIVGGVPCSTLSGCLDLSAIDEANDAVMDPPSMMAILSGDNRIFIDTMYNAFYAAEDEEDEGVMNYIAGIIDAFGKWQWQIDSSLGKKTMQESYNIYHEYIKKTKR